MARRPTYFASRFGLCRSVGHSWGRPALTRDADGLVSVRLTCSHCPTTRRDTLNPHNGGLVKRRYEHPEGYLVHGLDVTERPTKEDYRKVWIGDLMSRSRSGNVVKMRRAS
jgi:hypothetical protein